MRYLLLIGLMVASVNSDAQTMTMITTLLDGSRDTIKFGFVQNSTLGEDVSLGEKNLFMTPVNGYEGRILQRDSINFSCGSEFDIPDVYFPDSFDSESILYLIFYMPGGIIRYIQDTYRSEKFSTAINKMLKTRKKK